MRSPVDPWPVRTSVAGESPRVIPFPGASAAEPPSAGRFVFRSLLRIVEWWAGVLSALLTARLLGWV